MDILQLQSALGLAAFPLLAWLLRERSGALSPTAALRVVAVGIALQIALALAFLLLPPARAALAGVSALVRALQEATGEGARLVFGYLAGGPAPFETVAPANSFLLAFQALPLILVVSALTALLHHWGILHRVVSALAWALRRSMGVEGPVAMGAAANLFVGMVEAPLFLRPWLGRIDRGGLFAVMAVGLATIAGTVLALYAGLLEARLPGAAGHLVVASVISAPAALLLARLMVGPGDGGSAEPGPAAPPDAPAAAGPIDAIMRGTEAGIRLLAGVVAALIVFVALVALVDMALAALARPFGLALSLERIGGWLFAPLVWLAGVPWAEATPAGGLMAIKTVTNEFVAILGLAGEGGAALSDRSRLILAYALAGFANFGSLGILVGGLSAIVPERRAEIAGLGPRALVAGTLATLMTGAVIGLLTPPGTETPWAI